MNTSTLFPVMILAGGLATRLHPLSQNTPKSLISIHQKPFLFYQLELLQKQQITEVIICAGYLGEMILQQINKADWPDLNIHYSFDGEKKLGTAGAIKKAISSVHSPFFVLNGDSYLTADFLSIQHAFIKNKKKALMTVFYNQNQWVESNITFADQRIIAYDKIKRTSSMQHIDYGLSIFDPCVFDSVLANTELDLALIYQNLLLENQLAAYEVHERFFEIGSFSGIKAFEKYLEEK